ncbi:hypothetical protein WQ57_25055 [Mesobacillus campisalis]|uniref:Uncharacterized protein n=1 Tax=Mesobacillus campisalis TaxID=1408103 RepID=A0A0M2SHU1_9BACI|nr:hypothetical protein [Mesobacillus campisalis]KKK33201.1 hypothetical protein WQ57_25055 [Mesobacillus campisalis]
MNSAYAVEVDPLIAEIPEFNDVLRSNPGFAGVHGLVYLFHDKAGAEQAADLCREAGLLEEVHSLVCLKNAAEGELFADYGFKSGERVYLFKDLVSAFTLEWSALDEARMAKLQIEEHLVAAGGPDSWMFFIDRQMCTLMEGIAQAYGCKALFLDLDKRLKKL